MTAFLLSSLSVSSQTGIVEPDVKIKRSNAIKVVKDLERFDSLKARYILLEENISNLRMISEQKDLKIEEYKANEASLRYVIENYAIMQQSSDAQYHDLQKKHKKEVRAGRFKLVLLGGALAFGIYQTLR